LKKTRTALKRTGEARPKPVTTERPGSWHLARTETERRLSEFEFRLERLAQAYYRWKAACLAAVCNVPLTGDDVAVLNVVRKGSSSRKETRYRATQTGRSVTEAYAALRAATLPPMLEALDGWADKSEAAGAHLELVASLYAQAAQIAITRRHQP
jgi:predicted MarR family transcription regulator